MKIIIIIIVFLLLIIIIIIFITIVISYQRQVARAGRLRCDPLSLAQDWMNCIFITNQPKKITNFPSLL